MAHARSRSDDRSRRATSATDAIPRGRKGVKGGTLRHTPPLPASLTHNTAGKQHTRDKRTARTPALLRRRGKPPGYGGCTAHGRAPVLREPRVRVAAPCRPAWATRVAHACKHARAGASSRGAISRKPRLRRRRRAGARPARTYARTLAGQADGYAQLVLPAGSARTRACTRVGYTSSTRAATSGGGSAGGRGA